MLTPYSPLDFIEALERERRESIRADAHRISIFRRLARGIAVSSRLIRIRRPRPVPNPA